MVLHNNKWDRRAKHKYLKKHGLSSEDVKRNQDKRTTPEAPEAYTGQTNQEPKKLDQAGPEGELDQPLPLDHQQGIEIQDLYPEYEADPEEAELIRKHVAEQAKNAHTTAKSHVQVVDKSIFQRAERGAERSRLNQRVKRIGVKNTNKEEPELDSDSDFDNFMDQLSDDETNNAQVTPPRGNRYSAVDTVRVENEDDDENAAAAARKAEEDARKKHEFLDNLLQ